MSKLWDSRGLPSFICLWGVTSEQSSEGCDDLDGSRPRLSCHRLPGDKNWGCLSGPWRWLVWGAGTEPSDHPVVTELVTGKIRVWFDTVQASVGESGEGSGFRGWKG